jgi:site-specific recombinase
MGYLTRWLAPLTRRPWWPRPGNGLALEPFLDEAERCDCQVERHIWLIRLIDWIRRGEPTSGTQLVLRLLEQHPERRARVVRLLAEFWREVDVAALLADYGFPPRTAFLNELGERLRRRMLPMTPETMDLGALFHQLFGDPDDAQWLSALDDDTLARLTALWQEVMDAVAQHERVDQPLGWREPFFDAMFYLATQIRGTGFSPAFRSRMGMRLDADFEAELLAAERRSHDESVRQAFRQLGQVTERVHDIALAHVQAGGRAGHWPTALLHEAQYLRLLLDRCAQGARGLHGHLEEHGISVDLVFQIDQLCERCRRLEMLLDVALAPQPGGALRHLLIVLVEVGERRRSVRALFRQHTSQLARKVAERSAETGEQYITRTRAEYTTMLKRACGGGAVMAVTTYLKFGIAALALSPFWLGMAAGLNYATSFVLIQLLHFTVATKQPAMTAPAMAARLSNLHEDEAVERFVDEVANLIRSQVAGIVGNMVAVAPLVFGAQWLSWWLTDAPAISAETARYVLNNLTLLGPTLFFAAFTGVLLFASSMIAGWTENAFVLHKLDSALRWNPHIRAWVGVARATRWAQWWRKNISGLAANISLGFMLGVVPVVASFLALPLDVRHVTLSTGQVAAALGALGWDVLHQPGFWWCVVALPLTGLLNVAVSFTLALRVAMRSRGVKVKDRARLRAAIWRRSRRQPFSFVWPPRSAPSSVEAVPPSGPSSSA